MNILYDGKVYALQETGGINRYFANIISRLPDESHPTLTTNYRASKLHYPTHPNLNLVEYRGFRPHRISERARKYYFQYATAFRKFDVAHPTYYSLVSEQNVSSYRCPMVVTVYDMIHELFSGRLDSKGEMAEAKRKIIFSAQAVICISESTKHDLLDRDTSSRPCKF